jgi:hypothetical protein
MADERFFERLEAFFTEFGRGRTMVLSTSADGRVSSRMVSIVLIDGRFYFQTDTKLRKYFQLKDNPRAALCIDNIQIEGECRELGRPSDNKAFCKAFSERFEGSFRAYSGLENERLFELVPTFTERWIYKDGVPFIEVFDIPEEKYSFEQYSGR